MGVWHSAILVSRLSRHCTWTYRAPCRYTWAEPWVHVERIRAGYRCRISLSDSGWTLRNKLICPLTTPSVHLRKIRSYSQLRFFPKKVFYHEISIGKRVQKRSARTMVGFTPAHPSTLRYARGTANMWNWNKLWFGQVSLTFLLGAFLTFLYLP